MKRLTDNIRNLLDLHTEPANPPLEPLGRGPLEPEPRRPAHVAGCWCAECWERGMDYAHYLKQKRLQEI